MAHTKVTPSPPPIDHPLVSVIFVLLCVVCVFFSIQRNTRDATENAQNKQNAPANKNGARISLHTHTYTYVCTHRKAGTQKVSCKKTTNPAHKRKSLDTLWLEGDSMAKTCFLLTFGVCASPDTWCNIAHLCAFVCYPYFPLGKVGRACLSKAWNGKRFRGVARRKICVRGSCCR